MALGERFRDLHPVALHRFGNVRQGQQEGAKAFGIHNVKVQGARPEVQGGVSSNRII